ncbi:TPA: hypothetical protein ACIRVE_004240 [Pseudomonas putida]
MTEQKWQLERRATLLLFFGHDLSISGALKFFFDDFFLTFSSADWQVG